MLLYSGIDLFCMVGGEGLERQFGGRFRQPDEDEYFVGRLFSNRIWNTCYMEIV